MAYNNAFPMNYPQYYPQYQQSQVQAPVQSQAATMQGGNMIWVQGEAGAKSYLVAPNTTVQLWDSEAQTIYLKSADGSGMPSMKILDYVIRDDRQAAPSPVSQIIEQPSAVPNTDDFVTHEELQDFKDEIKSMIKTPTQKRGGSKDE